MAYRCGGPAHCCLTLLQRENASIEVWIPGAPAGPATMADYKIYDRAVSIHMGLEEASIDVELKRTPFLAWASSVSMLRRRRHRERALLCLELTRSWQRQQWESWLSLWLQKQYRRLEDQSFLAWARWVGVLPPGLVDSSESD